MKYMSTFLGKAVKQKCGINFSAGNEFLKEFLLRLKVGLVAADVLTKHLTVRLCERALDEVGVHGELRVH